MIGTYSKCIMTTNPRAIISEVGQWAQQQPWHPQHAPDYGLIEEFGELFHAILKNIQGIRGFDDKDTFEKAVKDAIGDMMVYLCHWCYLNKGYFSVYTDGQSFSKQAVRPLANRVLISIHRIVEISHWEGPTL